MLDVSGLKTQFREVYPGSDEPVVCRAPGRVNIIGEHTDYNGLPVLPCAIHRDICIAFAPRRDSEIHMADTDARYPHATFTNARAIPVSAQGAWENYCKAAVQGINDRFTPRALPGINLLVSGDVPISAGLSSSSALVVACALAYLRCLGLELDTGVTRLDLAGLMAEAEQYVGTRGGGMDQSVILMGQEGAACKIDFFPIRVEQVPLLSDYSLVICNSLIKAEKTGDTLHRYNAGPRLSRLICALVERHLQGEFDEDVEVERLGDLWNGALCLTSHEVEDLFAEVFRKDRMTLAEAASRLGVSTSTIRERWLGDLAEPAQGFRLKARARHQLTEYRRVESARDALLAQAPFDLGELMNASHRSCADDYEISCPELEELVSIAREAGALGARLTGAGFGGCTVSLVADDGVPRFQAQVRKWYYEGYLGSRGLSVPDDAVFTARSSAGAKYL